MFKIRTKNFRKIKQAELEVSGLVWITGPTDHGKSCLLKAIPALMENPTGGSFINYDADETTVELEFDNKDGRQKVQWVKPSKGSGTYTINDGEPLSKTGSSTPPEVSDLGFKVIQIKDTKYNLHYWPQGEYFLVKDTPTYIFLMISRLLKHRNLIPMLKQMKRHSSEQRDQEKELSGQFKMLEKKRQSLEEQLALYTDFPEHHRKYLSLKQVQEVLNSCVSVQERVEAFVSSYGAITHEILNISRVLDGFAPLSSVEEKISTWKTCIALKNRVDGVTQSLSAIPQNFLSYQPLDFSSIESDILKFHRLEEVQRAYIKTQKILESIPLRVLGYSGLDLEPVNVTLQNIKSLENLKGQIDAAQHKLKLVLKEVVEVDSSLADLDTQWKQLYIDYPQCPTCGRPWENCKEKK